MDRRRSFERKELASADPFLKTDRQGLASAYSFSSRIGIGRSFFSKNDQQGSASADPLASADPFSDKGSADPLMNRRQSFMPILSGRSFYADFLPLLNLSCRSMMSIFCRFFQKPWANSYA